MTTTDRVLQYGRMILEGALIGAFIIGVSVAVVCIAPS